MKVLLISANTYNRPYPVYPLGLDYVAGAVNGRHTVEISDINTLAEGRMLESKLADFRPDLIGISLRNVDTSDSTDPQGFLDVYKALGARIRSVTRAPVVLGGSAFTLFPEAFLEAMGADFGILGEGERIALLIEALERGEDPTALDGVIGPGKHCKTPAPWSGPCRRRLDRADDPDAHAAYYLRQGGMLNIQSKRGCRFRCIYCTYPYIEGRRIRPFSPAQVAETARCLQEAGARYLFMADATFNTDIDHSLAVARAMTAAGVSIPWGAFFAPMRHPPDYFRQMAAAGLTHVEFGTESLSAPVLSAYGKPFSPTEAFAAHRAAVDAGLHTAHYFLLGGPGETPETVEETLAGAEKLAATAALFFFCGMRIYPHTPLAALAQKEGVITAETDLLTPVFYPNHRVDLNKLAFRLKEAGRRRPNWVVGAGGEETAAVLQRLYRRGRIGPLWEKLIPTSAKG